MKMALFDGLTSASRALRKEHGLTQAGAAEKAGVSESGWCKWEIGRQPSPESLPKILVALGCSEVELWQKKVEIEAKHYETNTREISGFTARKLQLIESGYTLFEGTNKSVETIRELLRELGAGCGGTFVSTQKGQGMGSAGRNVPVAPCRWWRSQK
jgi:transcriptional regulator with XRE-family HTH domain